MPESRKRADEIFRKLDDLRRRIPDPGLWPFQSLASARQYLRLYRLAARWIPAGGRVLDWGGGNGHFSFFLADSGFETTAYSFEIPNLLEILKSKNYHFRCADPADPIGLPFPDASFQAVCSVGVLEHVRETGGNESASLKEIFRVLEPGGCFLVYHLPNLHSWIEALASLFPARHRHRCRYGRKDIRRLCGDAGFAVVELRRYGSLPRNFWAWAPRILRTSRAVAAAWDALDAAAGILFRPFCQNHCFVARKPRPPV